MSCIVHSAVAIGLLTGIAHAEPCMLRVELLKLASDKYGEVLSAGGSTRDGSRFTELLLAPNGSWTIITSTPEGWSCVAASGVGWDALGGIPGEDG